LKFALNYEFVHKDNILNSIKANAQQLIGYVESWSLYQELVAKDEPIAQNYIQQIQIKLKDILKTSDLSKRVPLFITIVKLLTISLFINIMVV
jgi:hypothetical protein